MGLGSDGAGNLVQAVKLHAVQKISTSGAEATSAAFSTLTTHVRIAPSEGIFWQYGDTVSVTTGHFLAGGGVEFVPLNGSGGQVLSVIQNDTGGFVTLSEVH